MARNNVKYYRLEFAVVLYVTMATFLDVTGLQYFSSLFVFLFTWGIAYSALLLSGVFAENKILPIFLSILIAIFVIITPSVSDIIRSIAPWLGLIFFIIILMLTTSKVLLSEQEALPSGVKGAILMIILFSVIIGVLVNVRTRVGEPTNDDGNEFSTPKNLFLHPKMLGMVLLLAIAIATIALLTAKMPP